MFSPWVPCASPLPLPPMWGWAFPGQREEYIKEWGEGGGGRRDKKTAGVWAKEAKWKDIEGLTSACQRAQYCWQALSVGIQREEEGQKNNLYFSPLLQTQLLTPYRLHRVWGTHHALCLESYWRAAQSNCTPTISPSPPAHGTVHLKGCMSSQCVQGPLWEQLLTAHSPLREHSLSPPPAGLHLFLPCLFFFLFLLPLVSLFPSFSRAHSLLSHTHAFSDSVVLGHILYAVTGRHHPCTAGFFFFYVRSTLWEKKHRWSRRRRRRGW